MRDGKDLDTFDPKDYEFDKEENPLTKLRAQARRVLASPWK